MDLKFLT